MIDSNVTTAGGNRQEENLTTNGFSGKLLSTREAADFLGVTTRTLKRWRKTGKLAPSQKGDNGKGNSDKYSVAQLLPLLDPTKGDTTLAKGDTSPTKGDTMSPTKGDTTLAKGDTSPAKGDTSPAKGDTSPAKGDTSPAKGDTSPAKGDTSPAKGDTMSPAKGDTQNLQSEKTVCMEVNLCKRQTPLSHTQEAITMKKQTLAADRVAEAEKFFNLLFGGVVGKHYGYLWTKTPNETFPFDVSQAEERAAMARKAIDLNNCGRDVYLGVNVADEPPATSKRHTAAQISLQTTTVTDIDVRSRAHKGDPDKFPPDIKTAKSFLPFRVSLVVDSGYGLHCYCLYSAPVAISDDNRDEAKSRNQKFIETVRSRADKFSGAVDGVGDLARVLRVPGTFNYKLGKTDPPLCHVVEATDVRFTADELDRQLSALMTTNQSARPASKPSRHDNNSDFDSTGYDVFRAHEMLNLIPCAELSYDDWLAVGMALKTIGLPCTDWAQWSATDAERFKDGECDSKWQGFTKDSVTIATLHDLAKQYGYDEAATRREWFDLHPEQAQPPAQADDEVRKAEKLARLESLSAEPQSAARDSKLINAIKDCLDWSGGKNKYIKPTYKNLRFIFDHDPALRGLFGFDQFEGVTVFLREPPWKRTTNYRRQWTDDDDAQLRLYLRQHYNDLACRQLTDDLSAELKAENSFNVVKEFFYNLPEWDGVKRAENLFIKFLRVDDTAYAREVTLNWLTAAVARILNPGCRYHTALVLHGAQKIGKSYVIERLGGKWYGAVSDDVSDSHAIDAIQNLWIAEFKELAAMRKTDVNKIKEFVEIAVDNRREAYARRAKMTPRHCVFAITVNDSEFLRDVTGNRRFMILHSNSEKFAYINGLTDEYIKQVWAEVYAHYKELFADGFDEHLLQLSRDTERQAEEIAGQYLQDDGLTTEIKSFLDEKILPQFIWQLLSRDERRQFFARKELQLFDGRYALEQRIKARYQGNISKINSVLEKLSDFLKDATCTRYTENNDNRTYFFVGTEYRQHICAAEIFNECFGHDSRKKMFRINEILSQLDGWELRDDLRKELRNVDPAYRDQKKPFFRIEQPADATPAQNDDPLQGIRVSDEEDIPF